MENFSLLKARVLSNVTAKSLVELVENAEPSTWKNLLTEKAKTMTSAEKDLIIATHPQEVDEDH